MISEVLLQVRARSHLATRIKFTRWQLTGQCRSSIPVRRIGQAMRSSCDANNVADGAKKHSIKFLRESLQNISLFWWRGGLTTWCFAC